MFPSLRSLTVVFNIPNERTLEVHVHRPEKKKTVLPSPMVTGEDVGTVKGPGEDTAGRPTTSLVRVTSGGLLPGHVLILPPVDVGTSPVYPLGLTLPRHTTLLRVTDTLRVLRRVGSDPRPFDGPHGGPRVVTRTCDTQGHLRFSGVILVVLLSGPHTPVPGTLSRVEDGQRHSSPKFSPPSPSYSCSTSVPVVHRPNPCPGHVQGPRVGWGTL